MRETQDARQYIVTWAMGKCWHVVGSLKAVAVYDKFDEYCGALTIGRGLCGESVNPGNIVNCNINDHRMNRRPMCVKCRKILSTGIGIYTIA